MEGFTLSIEELKKIGIPASPTKSSKDLTCAIASKPPMKHIKTDKMFSMTITDEDPTFLYLSSLF